MPETEYIILVGLLMGTIARFYLLKVDFRQYPSYPQGYIIHLILGAIASGLGAVVIPAVLNKEYAAVTFLAIAIQQFREVRRMERDSLDAIEQDELVKRGQAYIEDISKKFEARNYVAMLTAVVSTASIYIFNKLISGVAAGMVMLIILTQLVKTKRIGDIAEVRAAEIHFKDQYLAVEEIVILNVGLQEYRDKIKKYGKAAVIIPKNRNAAVTLSNLGQRQAIVHDIVSILGIRKETDEPDFTPVIRRNSDTGKVAVVVMTTEEDIDGILTVIKKTPLLESSKKQPGDSYTDKLLRRKENKTRLRK